jgi:hypothetical protein
VSRVATAPAPSATPARVAAQAGPYDPNAFLTASPAAATATAAPATTTDRYGLSTAQPTVPADRYGLTSSAPAAPAAPVQATTPIPSTPAAADRYGIVPVTSVTPPTADTTYPASAQPTVTAGQYRPAGTSTYEGPGSHVEVASRPSPTTPAVTPQAPTTQTPASAYGGSQPY